MLDARRLSDASVRWQLDREVGAAPLSVLDNYDRKETLQQGIDLVAPHAMRRLNAESHHHMDTSTAHPSCGKGIVVDGCEKLRYTRCSCIDQQATEMQVGCAEEPARWYTGFCNSSPVTA